MDCRAWSRAERQEGAGDRAFSLPLKEALCFPTLATEKSRKDGARNHLRRGNFAGFDADLGGRKDEICQPTLATKTKAWRGWGTQADCS
jgi:hypothetical protein